MALTPGTRLNVYEITAQIGAGGMGEVYKATDTNLKRQVAIKVLPAVFAADPERMARFQREAEVLASLNHPNIAHIHGLEKADGTIALVMELVEGEDLSEKLKVRSEKEEGQRKETGQRAEGGGLPLDEALPIAKQIADALEAAHEQGIIHRDLKPANIKVRPDGTVKVLDFGLAKAMEPTGAMSASVSMSPTITTPAMTQAGMILGTAAYMSPEQAKGRPADKRSDIWAFGCVLFEMLAGTRAFEGDDVSDTLAAILRGEPEWTRLPTKTPLAIRKLLRRCLEKDRKRRLDSAAAARLEIEEAITAPAANDVVSAGATAPAAAGKSAIVWKAAAGLLAVLLLAGLSAAYVFRPAAAAVTRFFVFPPDKATFVMMTGATAASGVISPDGRTLAFTARDDAGKVLLWVRPIDALAAQPLVGTENAASPFWSPDSRFIAYFAPGKLLKISASGGPPQTVSERAGNRGGAWNRDGVIVFNTGQGLPLSRVSSAGGQATQAMKQLATGQESQIFPSFLPDGHHLLLYNPGTSIETAGIYVGSLDTGDSTFLLGADSSGVFDPGSGRLLFLRQGTLMAQPFSPKTLTLADEPVPIAERVESSGVTGALTFSVSDTGVLTYGVGTGSSAGLQMTWLDRQGKVVGTVGPPGNYRGLDLAPDGQHVAAHRHDGTGGDVWITEVSRGTTSRFTLDASQDNSSPIWSPDGTRIVFGSLRSGKWGLYVKPSNMAGNDERLLESGSQILPTSWSHDGIVYVTSDPKTQRDLWLLPLAGDRKPVPLVHGPLAEDHGQVSPDGKWLAYNSNETGRMEVYVQPFPAGAGRWPISTGPGQFPRWRRDSRELFYMDRTSGGKIFAVNVNAVGSALVAGAPKPLFDSGYINLNAGGPYHTFAVSGDGQRFLIPRPPAGAADAAPPPIAVVLNWAAGLKK